MKHLILVFALFLTSCCGAKQVVENTPKKEVEIETEIEVEAEVEAETETVSEVITEKKNDSVYFIKVANHEKFNALLKKHVSIEGNVDYKGFKSDSKILQDYIISLGENLPTEEWRKNQKLAYWINAYNAMTIDLIIRNFHLKSIKDIKDPWEQRLWKLGEKWYNLNEIEHQILRKMNEPRIHFAIVCASFSCPKLQNKAFTASKMEEQLTNATKEFLADSNRNEITSDRIKISKIFQWFSKDFKQDGDLIDFLNKYTEVQISDKAKKSYKDYNWDLND